MSTYRSKPSLKFILPVAIILAGFGFITIYNKVWFGLVLIIVIASLIAHMLLTTYYQIDGRLLKIKSGFLFNKAIAVDAIRKISGTKNPLSSPANSPDRFEIMYNKNDSIIVSPKDKTGFINELKKINPGIELD